MALGAGQELLVCPGLQEVVAVHKGHVFSLGQVQSRVSGAAEASVFLVEDLHQGLHGGVGIAEDAGVVGGAVVDEQDLLHMGLGADGVDAPAQVLGHIVDGNDDRDHGSFAPFCSLS